MDGHTRNIQQYVETIAGSNNSKVLSKDKYDKIVSQLSGSANGDNSAKFRWWIKNKGFQLLNFPELSLNDVLCVPAKKQVTVILNKAVRPSVHQIKMEVRKSVRPF